MDENGGKSREEFKTEEEYLAYLQRTFGGAYQFRRIKPKKPVPDELTTPRPKKQRTSSSECKSFESPAKEQSSDSADNANKTNHPGTKQKLLPNSESTESKDSPAKGHTEKTKSSRISKSVRDESDTESNTPKRKKPGRKSKSDSASNTSPTSPHLSASSATTSENSFSVSARELTTPTPAKSKTDAKSIGNQKQSKSAKNPATSQPHISPASPANSVVSNDPKTPKITKTPIPSRPSKDIPTTPTFVSKGKFWGLLPTSRNQRVLRLPIFEGADLLSKAMDFKLPYDLWKEMKVASLEKALLEASKKPDATQPEASETTPESQNQMINTYVFLKKSEIPHFDYLHRNYYKPGTRPRVTEEDILVCNCKIDHEKKVGCLKKCVNRCVFYECNRSLCPCGEFCQNQNFQRRKYAKTKVVKTEGKGYGFVCAEDVKAGQFIIEYCGEVIADEECRERLYQSQRKGESNFYFLTLGNNLVVDASLRGNYARFINHSCAPNCETQKWTVNGEVVVGLFAMKDIPFGTELTFDYQFERVGAGRQICRCGAQDCRGYIGSKPPQSSEKTQKKKVDELEKKKPRSARLIARVNRRNALLTVLENRHRPQNRVNPTLQPVFQRRVYHKARIYRSIEFDKWVGDD